VVDFCDRAFSSSRSSSGAAGGGGERSSQASSMAWSSAAYFTSNSTIVWPCSHRWLQVLWAAQCLSLVRWHIDDVDLTVP